MYNRRLVFENGMNFIGKSFGSDREVISEVVFNTSMVGYQEVISDLSYYNQIVCMTYPLIGNYGLSDDDYETKNRLGLSGLIVHEYNDKPSNFRYTKTLNEVLKEYDTPGIFDVDTRNITRMIRDYGSMLAVITNETVSIEEAINKIKNYKIISDHITHVSCKRLWYRRAMGSKFKVVVIDCGVKRNIIRTLNKKKCNTMIVPYDISAKEILNLEPDGIVISNGPGDPKDDVNLIELIKEIQGRVPIFGICLGHQLIALANGADIIKLKFGHRGGNHPVKNLVTNKIEITSQNHSYVIDKNSLKNTKLEVTHLNLLDETIEGIEIKDQNVFSVQYHPEASPGPHDSLYLFDKFIENMLLHRKNKKCEYDQSVC